ncbi:NAD(P)-binding protein [Mycena chlorophos]|uniref:NAD(P)-binding protein n=1 Tax=Mycena chlorophos TaxID=658473 RepID=A0A8H6SN94_MYCCL|nr:NAD(P)-binding protein [Mycena chlorophos]
MSSTQTSLSLIQPIKNPVPSAGAGDSEYSWYYASNAGGMKIPFSRHYGKPMHQVDLAYLKYASANSVHAAFTEAFGRYEPGLNAYIDDVEFNPTTNDYNFMNALVPFGKLFKGKRLGDCHDKQFFEWCSQLVFLRKKYPLFDRALDHRLRNQHQHLVWLDVGARIRRSKYKAELVDEPLSQADWDLIKELDKAAYNDGQWGSSDSEEATTTKGDPVASDSEGESLSSDLDGFIVSDSAPIVMDTDEEVVARAPVTPQRKLSLASAKTRKGKSIRSFVVPQDESDGSYKEDSQSADSESDDEQFHERQTRSSVRKKNAHQCYSCTDNPVDFDDVSLAQIQQSRCASCEKKATGLKPVRTSVKKEGSRVAPRKKVGTLPDSSDSDDEMESNDTPKTPVKVEGAKKRVGRVPSTKLARRVHPYSESPSKGRCGRHVITIDADMLQELKATATIVATPCKHGTKGKGKAKADNAVSVLLTFPL